MRIPRHDPRFAGLRFLHVPWALAVSACRNLGHGGGPPASALNATSLSRAFKGPTFGFPHTSGGLVFGPPPDYARPGGDATMICRLALPAAPTGGGVQNFFGAGDTTSGFGFYYVVDSFTNVGLNFGVYYAADNWIRYASGVDLLGRDVVVAGVKTRAPKASRVYADGRRVDNAQLTTTDPTTFDFVDLWSGSTGVTLGYDAEAHVGFGALFDRALSEAELSWWGRESNWLPLVLEDEDWALSDGAVVNDSTVTLVGLRSVGSSLPAGGVRGRVVVDASLSVGGDLTAEPTSTGATLKTVVGVRSTGAGGIPTTVRVATNVGVGQTITGATPTRAATVVGVRQSWRALPDGRVDLLGVARYRR